MTRVKVSLDIGANRGIYTYWLARYSAFVIADPRDPLRLVHGLPQILRARILAIACGYENANDLDRLRFDPAFKLACGRLPDSGLDLCSLPTMSR